MITVNELYKIRVKLFGKEAESDFLRFQMDVYGAFKNDEITNHDILMLCKDIMFMCSGGEVQKTTAVICKEMWKMYDYLAIYKDCPL